MNEGISNSHVVLNISEESQHQQKLFLEILRERSEWQKEGVPAPYFPTPRQIIHDPSEKSINKTYICKNKTNIYINKTIICTNITFIYSF